MILLNHAVETANALQPHVHALAAGGVPNPGAGQAPPGADKFLTIIKWVAWIVFSVCVAGLLAGAGTMAIHHRRHGGGGEAAQGLVMPMLAAVVAASASGIIGVLAT